MKLSSFSTIITNTFTDTMNVFRYTPVQNPDGTTDISLPDIPTLPNRPCRLSYIKLENAGDTNVDSTLIQYMPKLFFKVSDEILPGDYIIVNRVNDAGESIQVYEGHIGLPSVFVTHKEALFAIKGEA